MKNSPSVLFCLGKRTKEGCDKVLSYIGKRTKEGCEDRSASSLVVPLGKAINELPLPLSG